MTPELIRVLVLHRNALFGEGLGRLLRADADLDVHVVHMADAAAADAAFAEGPDVVVLEDGGTVGMGEVLERTPCSLLLSVSIGSPRAWRLTRASISPEPEHLAREIAGARGQVDGDVVAVPVASRAGRAAAALARVLGPAIVPTTG